MKLAEKYEDVLIELEEYLYKTLDDKGIDEASDRQYFKGLLLWTDWNFIIPIIKDLDEDSLNLIKDSIKDCIHNYTYT